MYRSEEHGSQHRYRQWNEETGPESRYRTESRGRAVPDYGEYWEEERHADSSGTDRPNRFDDAPLEYGAEEGYADFSGPKSRYRTESRGRAVPDYGEYWEEERHADSSGTDRPNRFDDAPLEYGAGERYTDFPGPENPAHDDYDPRKGPEEEAAHNRERNQSKAQQKAARRRRRQQIVRLQKIGIAAALCAAAAAVIVTVTGVIPSSEPQEVERFSITEPITEEMLAALQVQETEEEPVSESEEETSESQEEEETIELTIEGIVWEGTFELPLEGATGYASVSLSVLDENGAQVASLDPGEAFVLLDQDGSYCSIETADGITGRVQSACVWVNLPDVIPSIIYYDVNSDSSMFRSSGYDLPDITGESLYDTLCWNDRLGEEQYCMPVQYSMALKIMEIQQACLANGESLKIYQTFRPYETQMAVAEALQVLENSNSTVYEGLNSGSWSDTWFIAMKLSNHQRGCAIDVSLVRVDAAEQCLCGDYLYTKVTAYTEYEMPTEMHELSWRAAIYDPPVSSSNDTDWRTATYASTVNDAALRLQDYCTAYGLSPLSSEWWHFNDLEARSESSGNASNGRFYLEDSISRAPS